MSSSEGSTGSSTSGVAVSSLRLVAMVANRRVGKSVLLRRSGGGCTWARVNGEARQFAILPASLGHFYIMLRPSRAQ